MYQCYAHAMPGIASLINLLITDALYYKGLMKLWYIILELFLISNYSSVKTQGVKVAYPFLTWEDPIESAKVVVAFHVMIAVLVMTLSFGFEIIKGRTLPTVEEARNNKYKKLNLMRKLKAKQDAREKIE